MNFSKLQRALACLVVAATIVSGCHRKSAEPTPAPGSRALNIQAVDEKERSRHFAAVSREIELGGTLYGYADVDGDMMKIAGGLGELLKQIASNQPQLAPFAKQDFPALFQALGLNDVKAIGLSSVPDGTGYFRNRVFLYTPQDRHGLLAGLGGRPGPFTQLKLAPADADFFAEAELDVPAVYQAIRDVVAKVGGEPAKNALEDRLRHAGEAAAFSAYNLINGMKGHAAMVLRLDPEKNLRLPGPSGVSVPAFSLLLCVEGVGQGVEPALARSPAFQRSDAGTLHVYELRAPMPVPDLKPVIAVEDGTCYFATSVAFLRSCREQTGGLAAAPAFREALSHVGDTGNGLTYVSTRFFGRLKDLERINADAPQQTRAFLHYLGSRLPAPDRPLIAVRINQTDGILIRSYLNRSMKQDLALIAVYNPVTIGMFAAMAVPAFQKVRTASQEKAILNNLRQLSAAADQYYLEQGVAEARFDDLVGPDRYIKRLPSVIGEDYRSIRFAQGEALRVRLPNGRLVEYQP